MRDSYVITERGATEEAAPRGRRYTLDELQCITGGFVDHVRLGNAVLFWRDDPDGILNRRATEMVMREYDTAEKREAEGLPESFFVTGRAVIVPLHLLPQE